jgi:hypothetical protein
MQDAQQLAYNRPRGVRIWPQNAESDSSHNWEENLGA